VVQPAQAQFVPGEEHVLETDTTSRDRWTAARDQWEKVFNEAEIPMTRNPEDIEGDLTFVEGLLYDKRFKGEEPVRCPCGCGYIRGCGGFIRAEDMTFIRAVNRAMGPGPGKE
jgi:hypothetical protein